MRINLLLLTGFILLCLFTTAQKNFVVYHVTGNVSLIKGNKITPAKRGDIIEKDNSLQLKPGADCMLIEEKGRSLQVAKPGIYTFANLQKMISTAGDGVTKKFFSYVYNNMFSGKQGDKLSVTPVVFRGEELMKLPADNTIIISDAFAFGWKKPAAKIPVHLSVWNNAGEIIIDTVLKNTILLPVNINNSNFKQAGIYKWKIVETGIHQSKEKYFYFLLADKKDRKQILKDVKLLQDKKLSTNLREQMQSDIFQKWKQYYLQET